MVEIEFMHFWSDDTSIHKIEIDKRDYDYFGMEARISDSWFLYGVKDGERIYINALKGHHQLWKPYEVLRLFKDEIKEFRELNVGEGWHKRLAEFVGSRE